EYMLESEVKPTSITFMATKDKQESYFDVFNRGEMHQIYKIKTINAKGYRVKPPMLSIGVNERQRVFVTFLGQYDKLTKRISGTNQCCHANVKNTVEQAWHAAKQITNIPEKRAYVNILFKDDPRRSIAEVNDAQKSVMGNKSQTLRPQTGSSRLDPSGSAGRDSDGSYYGGIPAPPKGTTKARKRSSGLSNCSTEPSEETNEEGNNRYCIYLGTKGKKKSVSQTVEATEEGGETLPPPIVVKPRSRRKVSAPPPEDEEEAPPSSVKTAIPVIRRKKSPARVAVAAEPAEEAPIAPKKTRKPVQQTEEEEEEAPPPPKPAHKPRSRRKTHSSTPP
ncbi:hypothetical protein PENTCL1PPCAC_23277, partial [Pristionchus entomophagus]